MHEKIIADLFVLSVLGKSETASIEATRNRIEHKVKVV